MVLDLQLRRECDESKSLYPRTDAEWREYCARAMRVLIANSERRSKESRD